MNTFYINILLDIPDKQQRSAFLGKNKYFIANLLNNHPTSLFYVEFPLVDQKDKEIFTYNRMFLEMKPKQTTDAQTNEPLRVLTCLQNYPRKNVKCVNSEEPAIIFCGLVEGLIPSVLASLERINAIQKNPHTLKEQPKEEEKEKEKEKEKVKPKEFHAESVEIRSRILFTSFCPMMKTIETYFVEGGPQKKPLYNVKVSLLSDYHFYGVELCAPPKKTQQCLKICLDIIFGKDHLPKPSPVSNETEKPQEQPSAPQEENKAAADPAEKKTNEGENQKLKKKNKKKSKKNKQKKEKSTGNAETAVSSSTTITEGN